MYILTRIWVGQQERTVLTAGKGNTFFCTPKYLPTQPRLQKAPEAIRRGHNGWNLRLTTELNLLSRLIMSEATLFLPCTPSWRVQGQPYIFFYFQPTDDRQNADDVTGLMKVVKSPCKQSRSVEE